MFRSTTSLLLARVILFHTLFFLVYFDSGNELILYTHLLNTLHGAKDREYLLKYAGEVLTLTEFKAYNQGKINNNYNKMERMLSRRE